MIHGGLLSTKKNIVVRMIRVQSVYASTKQEYVRYTFEYAAPNTTAHSEANKQNDQRLWGYIQVWLFGKKSSTPDLMLWGDTFESYYNSLERDVHQIVYISVNH